MNNIISAIAMFMSLSTYSGPAIQRDDINCMARAIYHEARNEPELGQIAVGHVILNRVGHPWYRDSVCEVVYQANQFTDINYHMQPTDLEAFDFAVEVAIFVWTGFINDPTGGAIMYHNPKKAPDPKWNFNKLVLHGDISNHRFYGEK